MLTVTTSPRGWEAPSLTLISRVMPGAMQG
jgi:hypothetical protein